MLKKVVLLSAFLSFTVTFVMANHIQKEDRYTCNPSTYSCYYAAAWNNQYKTCNYGTFLDKALCRLRENVKIRR